MKVAPRLVPLMRLEERLEYCECRRKKLEIQLKDAEILVALVKKHVAEADRLIDDIRVMSSPRGEI